MMINTVDKASAFQEIERQVQLLDKLIADYPSLPDLRNSLGKMSDEYQSLLCEIWGLQFSRRSLTTIYIELQSIEGLIANALNITNLESLLAVLQLSGRKKLLIESIAKRKFRIQ